MSGAVGILLLVAHREASETKKYVLKSWPAGYRMYDHNKVPEANPRHDLYVVGEQFHQFVLVDVLKCIFARF